MCVYIYTHTTFNRKTIPCAHQGWGLCAGVVRNPCALALCARVVRWPCARGLCTGAVQCAAWALHGHASHSLHGHV